MCGRAFHSQAIMARRRQAATPQQWKCEGIGVEIHGLSPILRPLDGLIHPGRGQAERQRPAPQNDEQQVKPPKMIFASHSGIFREVAHLFNIADLVKTRAAHRGEPIGPSTGLVLQ